MKRRLAHSLFLSLATITLLEASHAHSFRAGLGVLRVMCLPARPLSLTVAVEQGLFAKHGVAVQVQIAANSEELRGALAAGTIDLAHAAVDNAVALSERAHVDVIVVIGGEGSRNELIAQPGTRSVESLRGHTLLVDAPTTAYAIQ